MFFKMVKAHHSSQVTLSKKGPMKQFNQRMPFAISALFPHFRHFFVVPVPLGTVLFCLLVHPAPPPFADPLCSKGLIICHPRQTTRACNACLYQGPMH